MVLVAMIFATLQNPGFQRLHNKFINCENRCTTIIIITIIFITEHDENSAYNQHDHIPVIKRVFDFIETFWAANYDRIKIYKYDISEMQVVHYIGIKARYK